MEQNKLLEYCLTRNVKDPAYGTPDAGCLDFFVPEFDETFIVDLQRKNPRLDDFDISNMRDARKIIVKHGEDICVPSGVHVKLEKGTALTAFNKSGVATKLKLIRGAEYVDCDYTGEVHLHVINVGLDNVEITPGQKLVQFSYVPVYRALMKKQISTEAMYANFESERGEKWQGSTGTH